MIIKNTGAEKQTNLEKKRKNKKLHFAFVWGLAVVLLLISKFIQMQNSCGLPVQNKRKYLEKKNFLLYLSRV